MRERWLTTGPALLVGVVALVAAVVMIVPQPSAIVAHAGPAPITQAPRPAAPRATGAPAPDLAAVVARAVGNAAGVDLAVAVLDLDTGAQAGSREAVPFRSASLSKLVVALDVLADDPDDTDRDNLERALSASDDEAMNALWDEHDGMGAVERVAGRVGLTVTRDPEDATQWGDVETSAGDLVRLYRYILTELPEDQRDFVVTALESAPATAADGFDQAYGLLGRGVGGHAYAKQGWMWYLPDYLYLHSAGVVADRYAVALLSVQSGVDEETGRANVDTVTRALVGGLVIAG